MMKCLKSSGKKNLKAQQAIELSRQKYGTSVENLTDKIKLEKNKVRDKGKKKSVKSTKTTRSSI